MRRFYKTPMKPKRKVLLISSMVAVLCLIVSVHQGAAKSDKGGSFIPAGQTQQTQTARTTQHVSKPGCQYYGTVLRVGEDEIVVDDHLLQLSERVVYHVSGGGLFSKEVKEGAFIGFNLNKDKKITDIWIFKNK